MPLYQPPEAHALRSVAELGEPMGREVGRSGTAEGAPAKWQPNGTCTSVWRIGVGQYALFLGLLVFGAFPGVVLGTHTFVFRDFGLFSYPVALFQRESFWHGEVPLWNPLSYCGVPFLAQWNTMCLYPPALFYLVLPLSWALPMFCLLHLVWGGLGMYMLARCWSGRDLAGAVAGVVFAFNGLSLNFLMWPSHIATLSWLPWVIWLGQKAWREGGRALVWATAAGSLQMLAGGPETIAVTWFLLGLVLALDLLVDKNWMETSELGRAKSSSRLPGFFSQSPVVAVRRFATMAALVALICAPQLLPFLELLGQSQRDSAYSSTAHNWSMPMWGWANFLVPLFGMIPTAQGVYMQPGQYWTSSYYMGIATLPLVVIAVWHVRDWRVRSLAGLLYVSLVLAWGDTSVLYSALRWCIPALGFFRYPVKFVLPVVAVAPLLAAFGFSAFMDRGKESRRFEIGTLVLTVLALGVVGVLGSVQGSEVGGVIWQNALVRGALLLAVAGVGAWLTAGLAGTERNVRWHKLAMFLLLGLFWLDFRSHVPNQNPTVSREVYAADGAGPLANNQGCQLGQGRAMLNPADREALNHNFVADPAQNYRRNRAAELSNCNLLDGIAQVDGFFSLVPRETFRVTQLPYEQPGRDWSSLLDLMGVTAETAPDRSLAWRKRTTALPLITAGQQPNYADEATALVALSETNRMWGVLLPVQAREAITAAREPLACVRNAQFANAKITFETDSPRPCLVTIAQSYYPGWRAYVDGKQTDVWRANVAFQALQAPAGRHRVELRYIDRAFNWGVVLFLSGGGLWSVLLLQSVSTKAKLSATPY